MAEEKHQWNTATLVAAIGLFGTLGASLLTNWDKVFRTSKPPIEKPSAPDRQMHVPKQAADTYFHATGRFQREGKVWVEYPPFAPGQHF